MHDPAENPFASPTSVPDTPPSVPSDFDAGMPGSVKAAVIACCLLVALNALGLLASLMGPTDAVGSAVMGGTLLVGLLLVVGLTRSNRLARQWARVFSLLLSLPLVMIVVVTGGMAIAMSVGAAGFVEAELESDPILGPGSWRFLMLVGMAIYCVPLALLVTVFIGLGRESARRYFRLFCPSCGNRNSRAADFLYRKSRCRRCKAVW